MKKIKQKNIHLKNKTVINKWNKLSIQYQKIEQHLKKQHINNNYKKLVSKYGPFIIKKSQFEVLPDSKIKNYFSPTKEKLYSFKAGELIHLRGKKYYRLLEHKDQLEILNSVHIEIRKIIELLNTVNSKTSIHLYLATLDQLRNYLLILLFALNQTARNTFVSENEVENFINTIQKVINKFYLSLHTKKIYQLASIKKIKNQLKSTVQLIDDFLTNNSNKNIFRRYRESDNPFFVLKHSIKINKSIGKEYPVLIGVEYGAIELPFVVNAVRKFSNQKPLKIIFVKIANYSQGKPLNSLIPQYKSNQSTESKTNFHIMDDSVFSGRTLQIISQFLHQSAKKITASCLSMKISHRRHQAFIGGAVKPEILKRMKITYQAETAETECKENYPVCRVADEKYSLTRDFIYSHLQEN